MSLTGHAPTFRASAAAIVGGVLGIAAVTVVVDFVAGVAVVLALRSALRPSILNVVIGVVLVVIAIAGVLLILRRVTTRWVVADGELREEALGRTWRRWILATTTVRWHAARRLSNGVYQGTTRTLILQPFGGAERRVVPWRFDAERFTALLAALLGPELPEPLPNAPVDREYAIARGRLTRVLVVRVVVTVVVVAVLCGIVLFLADQDPPADAATALAELVLPPLVGAIIIGWIVGSSVSRARGVPRRIRVTRDGIAVDGREFAFAALSRIAISAPSTGPGERELVLFDGRGSATRFSLTGAPPATAALTTLPPTSTPHTRLVLDVVQAAGWRGQGFVQYLLG